MKNYIVVICLLLFTSCNEYITRNLYHQRYIDVDEAIADVYSQLNYYNVDSISLDQWISNEMITDTISIEQKIIRKVVNEKSMYTFVFSRYLYPTSFYYNFLIRYTGRKEDLK